MVYKLWCCAALIVSYTISLSIQFGFFSAIFEQKNFTKGGPCGAVLQDISAFPGDKEYDEGSIVFNQAYADIRGSFIAFPRNEDDVKRCLQCSVTHSIPCVVKSGGHSTAGYSTINGSGFIINLAKMKNVVVDKDRVVVQAGARWKDIYSKLNGSQLMTGGMCPSVGVGGYTLGGGYGILHRKYGLAIDNVLSMTMVEANGTKVVIADNTVNADLFWALRGGGGGNFGIVTSFTFKIYQSTYSNYTLGLLQFKPGSKSQQALATIGQIHPYLPNELYLDISVLHNKELSVALGYLGEYNDYIASVKPLVDLASTTNFTNYSSYIDFQHTFSIARGYDSVQTSGKPQYSRGCLLNRIDEDFADIVFKTEIPKGCTVPFNHLGGEVAKFSPNETAYFYRTAAFDYYSNCVYDKSQEFEFQSILDELYNTILQHGYCVGNYVNDMERTLRHWQEKYYRGNYQRLLKIKEKWNPLDLGYFHFLQEIGSKYND